MTQRIKVLTEDDDPPWSKIRAPSHRIRDPIRYVRSELGFMLGRHHAGADYVVVPCPVDDDDTDEHAVTLCRRGESVAITCEEKHPSAEVLDAILRQLK